jgi:hypothetical protein
MASHNHREQQIIDSVPCPKCGALVGERCKGLLDHTGQRGLPPMRSDQERRYAWQGWKRTVSAMLERKTK